MLCDITCVVLCHGGPIFLYQAVGCKPSREGERDRDCVCEKEGDRHLEARREIGREGDRERRGREREIKIGREGDREKIGRK